MRASSTQKFCEAKAFGGSFAKQRAERSECRDEHHRASEFESRPEYIKSNRKVAFFVRVRDEEPVGFEHKSFAIAKAFGKNKL